MLFSNRSNSGRSRHRKPPIELALGVCFRCLARSWIREGTIMYKIQMTWVLTLAIRVHFLTETLHEADWELIHHL